MTYEFKKIEEKWRKFWKEKDSYKVEIDKNKPKYYILDMFPYPSGAGLHVGHPRGYIASDIYARYKRNKGYNVLHPMGYDAFGLPAEQYAIQTGQHPSKTTEENIKRYREQLDLLGFSFDWDKSFKTCDPSYYKWTQWAFLKMFNSYYDKKENKAKPIGDLIKRFEKNGSIKFSKEEWNNYSEKEKSYILDDYRIAYLSDTYVNWCPELGTVLANDEIKDGLSVRGGHPVEQKLMKQWSLRVSVYAQRLLDDLESLEWSDSVKEMQKNWIGKSQGVLIIFKTKNGKSFDVYTTRPETIFGVTFLVVSPESALVESSEAVQAYREEIKSKSIKERQISKEVNGVFSGEYVVHPFTKKEIPVYVADYVLDDYGSGAIMAVPAHDERDYKFAKKYNLDIQPVLAGDLPFLEKKGLLINSDFLDKMTIHNATQEVIKKIEQFSLGKACINYRLRDAIFSRQRYWGEPFPIYFKDGIAYPVEENDLPLKLPQISSYKPTKEGKPPLARAEDWTYKSYPLECSTMPGFAGSSAYFFRYMDSKNNEELVSKEAQSYWKNVDLYVGGSEHSTGHLIYARFWTKFLYDLGYVNENEPFKKMLNQGMIQGRSSFVYRVLDEENTFVSYELKDNYKNQAIHVDVSLVKNDILDIEGFKKWRPEFKKSKFIMNDKYYCGYAVEKMSKSMFNVVNPDDIVQEYGADTLRIYEMFLGPISDTKPWSTDSISGSYNFLKKFYDRVVNTVEEEVSFEYKKLLNKAIKKITEDIESFSFNTAISRFMSILKYTKKFDEEMSEKLVILLSPFAPHMAQELWEQLGREGLVLDASWPKYEQELVHENTFQCPVMINNRKKGLVEASKEFTSKELESFILDQEFVKKHIQDKKVKKVVAVPSKICNIILDD